MNVNEKIAILGSLLPDRDTPLSVGAMSTQERSGNYYNPGGRVLTYLAIPFHHPRKDVMIARAVVVSALQMAMLQMDKIHTYSPITACLPLSKVFFREHPDDDAFWLDFDKTLLIRCSEMRVVEIPGFEDSKGVRIEREFCEHYNIPVGRIEWDYLSESTGGGPYGMSRVCKFYKMVYGKGMSVMTAFDHAKLEPHMGNSMRGLIQCLLN